MSGRASTHPRVTIIGSELAVPFITAYCVRWRIPCDTQGGEHVEWWGAWYKNALRAVLGLMPVLPEDLRAYFPEDDALFVYGFYGDGTLHELRAIDALWNRLDRIPRATVGAIYMPNAKMYRRARKGGWNLRAVLPEHAGLLVHRAAPEAV